LLHSSFSGLAGLLVTLPVDRVLLLIVALLTMR
jgi:hypothetical protein